MPYGYPYGGYGYSPWAPMPKEQEIAMLEEQARAMQDELDAINKRLEELRK
jgi:ubiquinone biosynthesis protein UbiJ